MARFYALIANGGQLVTPHVVATPSSRARTAASRSQQRFVPAAPQPIDVDPNALQAVRDGLYHATHGLNGTATGVFGTFPSRSRARPAPRRSGRAKHGRLLDQSWWCGYGPRTAAEIVVCA